MKLFMGIDLGTSNSKVAVFDQQAKTIFVTEQATQMQHQDIEQAQHSPKMLWQHVAELIQKTLHALTKQQISSIAAIGISSFGEAGIFVDQNGQALGDMLAWFDARGKISLPKILATHTSENIQQHTGLKPDHTYALCKMLIQDRTAECTWLSASDYVAFQLTGQMQMGYSQAARTMLLELESLKWWESMAKAFHLQKHLPKLRVPGQWIGTTILTAQQQTGLPVGIPILESAHDQVCAAFAMGANRAGTTVHGVGSVETFLHIMQPEEHFATLNQRTAIVGHHALQNQFYKMATMRNAGTVFDWFVRMLGQGKKEFANNRQALITAASTRQHSALHFFPHFRHFSDTDLPSLPGGSFFGLRETHDQADLCLAVLTGLSLESARLWNSLENTPPEVLNTSGGPSKNPLWMQLKANSLACPIQVFTEPHASALGAAMLAAHHNNTPMLFPEPHMLYKPNQDFSEMRSQHNQLLNGISSAITNAVG